MTIEATHNKILEYLKKHSSANTFRLSKHLGMDRIELIRLVDELATKGLAKFKSGVVTGFKEDKKSAMKILSDAGSDKEFRFCNGLHVKNMHELLLAF